MAEHAGLLSEQFLHTVVRQSKYVGVTLAVAGALVTHDYRFVVALGIGSAVDIVTLAWVVEHAQLAGEGIDLTKVVLGVTAFRLVVKSVLVVGAATTGSGPVIWGMVLGVLVFEITLMTFGVVDSIRQASW